eukprot:gene29200-37429_t
MDIINDDGTSPAHLGAAARRVVGLSQALAGVVDNVVGMEVQRRDGNGVEQ